MRTSHRLAIITVAALAAATAGCSGPPPPKPVNWPLVTTAPPAGPDHGLIAAAKKEGMLTVIGLPPSQLNYRTIIAEFTRTYGIKVHDQFPGATSQQAIGAVKTENNTSKAPDVLNLDIAAALANANLFAPYKVSTWNAIPPGLKDPTGLWAAGYGGDMAVGYNPKLGPITSLNQLLAPRFRHDIALAANPATAAGLGLNGVMLANPALGAVMMASLAHGGTPASITPGLVFFRQLHTAGNLSALTATDATIRAGTTPVVMNWDYLNQPAETGVPGWRTFIPPTAIVGGYQAQAINKDAPHPAAARLWEEFLYSQTKNGGQNQWLKAGARPAEMAAMTANGTINTTAAAKLPKATRPPVFLTPAQATIAATYLAANWARAIS
jgi:putative spermidine/putrescine transport system substrate-binding protein